MTPLTFILLSGTLTFGVPMALAARELLMLTPPPDGGDEPLSDAHPAPEPKPLPACLLPPPMPFRVLEDA